MTLVSVIDNMLFDMELSKRSCFFSAGSYNGMQYKHFSQK
jgi:hypothetical protein